MSLCVRMSVCPEYQASVFLAKQDTSGTQLYCDRRFRSQKKEDKCTVILLWSIHLRKACKLSGSWFPSLNAQAGHLLHENSNIHSAYTNWKLNITLLLYIDPSGQSPSHGRFELSAGSPLLHNFYRNNAVAEMQIYRYVNICLYMVYLCIFILMYTFF